MEIYFQIKRDTFLVAESRLDKDSTLFRLPYDLPLVPYDEKDEPLTYDITQLN